MDGKYILIILTTLVMGWFAVGILYNLRRGDAIMRWMQKGLPLIGERTTLRWLGTSVTELVIAKAKSPFRRMDILLVFLPRDLAWMWLIALWRGRRDILIVRADLVAAPKNEFDLVDSKSWTGRMALQLAEQRGWKGEQHQGLVLYAPGGMHNLARMTLDRLENHRQALADHYDRFSVRKETPHLEIHIPQPHYKKDDSGRYFESLQSLGRDL